MNPVILAHGALGAFDELVFLGIALVFIGMMAVSWYRSQHIILEEDDKPKNERHRKPPSKPSRSDLSWSDVSQPSLADPHC